MRTLDRSKPFGEVTGEHTASFWQNQCLYDHEGNIMEELLDDEGRARLAEWDKAHGVPQAADDEEDNQGGGNGAGTPADEPAPPPANGEINLTAWLEQGINYSLPQIKKVIRERYAKQFSPNAKKDQIIDFLIDEGVCNPDRLHAKHRRAEA